MVLPPTPVTPQRNTTSASATVHQIDTGTPTRDAGSINPKLAVLATAAPTTTARPKRLATRTATTAVAPARKAAGRRTTVRGSKKATKPKANRTSQRANHQLRSRRARPPSPPSSDNEPSDEEAGEDGGDNGNDGSAQPDDEPDGESDDDRVVDHRQITISHLPLGGKPNPKSLTLRQFTGRVKPGDFDSGVRQWCLELDCQLLGAQMRDGHRWTEPAKLSLMQNLLAEEPAVWFYRLWAGTESLTVKIACKKLREKYATKIGEDAIRDLIRSAARKPNESYEAYAQRLENMANALPGGIVAETNAAAALAAFVRMACPTHQTQLNVEWTQSQRRQIPARDALREMVEFISLLDRSNGIAAKPKTSKPLARKKAKGKDGKGEAKGLVAAIVTERKRKPAKRTVRLKTEPGSEYTEPEW